MKQLLIWILIAIVILIMFFLKALYNSMDEYSSKYGTAFTKENAKRLKVYIKDLDVSPRQFVLDGEEVIFGDVWVERAFTIKYKYFFLREILPFDKYVFSSSLIKPKKNSHIYDISDPDSLIWIERKGYQLSFDHKNTFTGGLSISDIENCVPIKLTVKNRKTGTTQEVVLK